MQEADPNLGDVDIDAFIKEHGLNQNLLAKAAHVSQSTVSRARKGTPERNGRARRRLFIYIHNHLRLRDEAPVKKKDVLRAFNRVWGTWDAHASAIAKVVGALDGLRPLRKEG